MAWGWVRPVGLEPTTRGLKGPCSTTELRPRDPGACGMMASTAPLHTGASVYHCAAAGVNARAGGLPYVARLATNHDTIPFTSSFASCER